MKTPLQSLSFFLVLTFGVLSFFSCSNEENGLIDKEVATAITTTTARPALPPPTPGELRGLYDAKFNDGTEFNLLFDYGNYVSYGQPTINDMTTQPGTRVSYVNVSGNTYQFSCTISGTVYNFRFTYDSSSAKFNGTYGLGSSYINLGTFNGKKHITGASGHSFLKGYWLGTYSGMFDYLMVFEEDGKVIAGANGSFYYNCVAGKGLYEMYGDTVIGYYIYPNGYKYSFKGTCNFASQTINGTWGHGDSNSDGGSFNLSSMNFY